MNQARVAAGAVILAAGLSSRFGGRPKALAELGGRSLLRGAAYKCRLVGVDRVTVVTGHHKTEVEEAAEALGLTTVHNPDFRQGMFSSIQAGVRAMAGLEAFFVWPVEGARTRPHTLWATMTARRS